MSEGIKIKASQIILIIAVASLIVSIFAVINAQQTGPMGEQGEKGEQGVQGPMGAKGATGPQGAKGDKGNTGANGTQGPPGPPGQNGSVAELFGEYNIIVEESWFKNATLGPWETEGAVLKLKWNATGQVNGSFTLVLYEDRNDLPLYTVLENFDSHSSKKGLQYIVALPGEVYHLEIKVIDIDLWDIEFGQYV